MFDKPSIEDMKVRPDLGQSEKVVFNTGAKVGDVFRDNVVIVVTTDRLLVGEKRGRNIDEDLSEKANIEIQLSDIDVIRRMGAISKHIEIVCEDSVRELPPLQDGSDELIDAIVEQENLGKSEWGEEGKAKRGTKQLVASIAGLGGLLIGALFTFIGFIGIISIIYILLGIPLLLGGVAIMYGSYKLIGWAFNKEEEWDRSVSIRTDSKVDEGTEVQLPQKLVNSIGKLNSGVQDSIPTGIWSYFVVLGSILWFSLFGLLENESLFALVMFTAWVLLPLAIYLDSIEIRQTSDWTPRWWAYVLLSLIPIGGSLFGFVWLARKRQKTGSALS